MKRRFGRIVIGGILLIFFSCVSVLAISEKLVNYHFFSKKVAVRMEYFEEKQGTYVPLKEDGLTVMPGEFISRIPMIYNEGMDCYLRMNVTVLSKKEPSVPITMENIVGMSEKWIPIGDYFYYKDVFLEDEVMEVFDGIYMPTEWVEMIDCGNQWEVQVKVDAIQAEHLAPNYQSEDPWGEQIDKFEILDAKEDEVLNDVIDEEALKKEFIVTIESEAELFQIEMEETFQSIGDFVPGDEKECIIKICNLGKYERVLHMKTEVSHINRLLAEMEVTVLWECEARKNVLYQGAASKVCDALEQSTLVVPGNGNGLLHVFFSLPKSADNNCTAWEGSLRFLFSNEKIPLGNHDVQNDFVSWPEDAETSDETKKPENIDKDESVQDDSAWDENATVQTGDENKIWNAIVGLSIGVCLFFLYLWKGKRGSHDR